MGRVTSSKDLIMLLLYARVHKGERCEPIRGRTRLMKMVFLFDKEIRRQFNLEKAIPDEAMPAFSEYDYGPFSSQVFSDLEFLVELEFVPVKLTGDSEPLPEEAFEYHKYWKTGPGSDTEDEAPGYEEEFSLTKLGRDFVKDELGVCPSNRFSASFSCWVSGLIRLGATVSPADGARRAVLS